MHIGIVGLGLIGGSMAKSVSKHPQHRVWGWDICPDTLDQALASGDIHHTLQEDFSQLDYLLLALYPQDSVNYIQNNLAKLPPGLIIVDLCGVKRFVCQQLRPLLEGSGVTFIGGHPMAGRECSGYKNAVATLFDGASMILTPYADTPKQAVEQTSNFFLALGFGHIEITTDLHHDEMIAYTSQLAHIVSSAYVQSPTAQAHMGFSAGSFKDLTRVAKLNEVMWSELFLYNKDYLVQQIAVIQDNLEAFRSAIEEQDQEELQTILRRGREIKEKLEEW